MVFTLRARLNPPAIFGLPDGDKIVLPIGPEEKTTLVSPTLDARTGKIAGYGTLSMFRKPEEALLLNVPTRDGAAHFRDNFVSVQIESPTAQEAFDEAERLLERVAQCLGVQVGQRVHVTLESFEDDAGLPHPAYVRKTVPLFSATVYNLLQLSRQLDAAVKWAGIADDRAKKALFYFEHAQLLEGFSKTLALHSPHAAFSMATAFLQMFKALVTIIGEAGVDSDYQRRAKQMGLGNDFWSSRVQPLYRVRNDSDVAHYSLLTPDPMEAHRRFNEASGVFRDVLAAYMRLREDAAAPGGSRSESPE